LKGRREQAHRVPQVPPPRGDAVGEKREGAESAERVELVIPVKPEPKLMPKVFKTKSGQVFAVTPGKKAHAEALMREFMVKAGRKFPGGVPLKLECVFYLPKPKSVRRSSPLVKPDLTAYLALLLDAGNGYLWEDDAQIVCVGALKAYGEPPRIELGVEPLGDPSGRGFAKRGGASPRDIGVRGDRCRYGAES